MNQDLLELALLDELRMMKRMKRLEADLIEQFDYAFNYVMTIAEENNMKLPNRGAMLSCLRRIKVLIEELSPEVKRSDESPDKEAVPSIASTKINWVLGLSDLPETIFEVEPGKKQRR